MPTNSEILETYAPYTAIRPTRVTGCGDDRPLLNPDDIFPVDTPAQDQIYNKVFGGPDGMATDRLVVLEGYALTNPKGYFEQRDMPKSHHARRIAKEAARAGHLLFNHPGCAARLGDYLVVSKMHDVAADLADELEERLPLVRKANVLRVGKGAGRLALGLEHTDYEAALAEMESLNTSLPGIKIPTVSLIDEEHKGTSIIYSLVENEAFDTAAAFADGNAAYYVNHANTLKLQNLGNVRYPLPDYYAATALRSFVIARHFLPGAPLNTAVKTA